MKETAFLDPCFLIMKGVWEKGQWLFLEIGFLLRMLLLEFLVLEGRIPLVPGKTSLLLVPQALLTLHKANEHEEQWLVCLWSNFANIPP